MKKLLFLTPFFILCIFTSCSSDNNDDDMMPLNNVTYIGHVKKIIDSKCLNCHSNPPSNGAPMSLTTYQNTREAVENRDLIGRVENGSMPSSGDKLTATQIKAIKDWKSGGFME